MTSTDVSNSVQAVGRRDQCPSSDTSELDSSIYLGDALHSIYIIASYMRTDALLEYLDEAGLTAHSSTKSIMTCPSATDASCMPLSPRLHAPLGLFCQGFLQAQTLGLSRYYSPLANVARLNSTSNDPVIASPKVSSSLATI